ncbi:MAG TPA: hypothetical protein VMM27_13695 [Casimicrobiaceae bacterium]|nr:hypothetical protein [Casimicrobiaceae bacterium]
MLQVAALGAKGPGRDGQSPGCGGKVHCAPVMLHVPVNGQALISMPSTGQVRVVQLLGLVKSQHTPVVPVHCGAEVHDRPAGLTHVPGVEEQPEAELQDWAAGVTHTPFTAGHVAAEVQLAKGGLLHVPFTFEQSVAAVQDWAGGLLHVPFCAGQSVFSVQAAPPTVQ